MFLQKTRGIIVLDEAGDIIYNNSSTLPESKHVRKHKSRKSIVYPIFEEMRKFTKEGTFWDILLTKSSRNSFPTSFKYYGNTLIYKFSVKKSRDDLVLDKDNLEDTFYKMKSFYINKGVLSPEDEKESRETISHPLTEIEEMNDWKSVKRSKMTEKLIADYINFIKTKYVLTKEELNNLKSVINVGIIAEYFHDDNIKVAKDKIIDLEGLCWDDERRLFFIDKTIKTKSRGGISIKNNPKEQSYDLTYGSGEYEKVDKVDINKRQIKFYTRLRQKKDKILKLQYRK